MKLIELKEKLKKYDKIYSELYDLAEETIKKLEILEPNLYNTGKGIEEISFDWKDEVLVTYNEWGGSVEQFHFPLEWLTQSNEELKKSIDTYLKNN